MMALLLTLSMILCPPAITEDDPRWDCNTMGNKICGPIYQGH